MSDRLLGRTNAVVLQTMQVGVVYAVAKFMFILHLCGAAALSFGEPTYRGS